MLAWIKQTLTVDYYYLEMAACREACTLRVQATCTNTLSLTLTLTLTLTSSLTLTLNPNVFYRNKTILRAGKPACTLSVQGSDSIGQERAGFPAPRHFLIILLLRGKEGHLKLG